MPTVTLPLDLSFGLETPAGEAIVFFITLVSLLLLRAILLYWLKALANRTASTVDNFALDAVRIPSLFWIMALAIDAALSASPLPDEVQAIVGQGVAVLIIFSATLVAGNVASGLLNSSLRIGPNQSAASGIVRTLVRGVVLLVGLSLVLHSLGVSIGPILTALGVGGLAVALALQDTLGNLFAGIHILLEKPFQIGHFVRLEGGDEGFVKDIGWRTTRLQTLNEQTVVIPNANIAGSKIINMSLPTSVVRVERPIGVGFGSDTAHVERVLLDELQRAVAELPQTVTEPPPDVLMVSLGAYSLDYSVRFYIRDISMERMACHHMITRIFNRLRAENIEIPFPFTEVAFKGSGPS